MTTRFFAMLGPAGAAIEGRLAGIMGGAGGRLPQGVAQVRFGSSDVSGVLAWRQDQFPPVGFASAPDGSFALVDGEVYAGTDRVLAKGLKEATEADEADEAGAILALWQRRGTPGLAAVDMAAGVVVWDARAQALTVLRDAVGHVPVYHARLGDHALVASDLPALLRAGIAPRVRPAALDAYLASGYVPSPWTLVHDVARVPPGHGVTIDGSGTAAPRCYGTAGAATGTARTGGDVVDALRRLLPAAVARRQARGRSLGLLLSGGVDSQILAGLAAQSSPERVTTFTFRYGGYDGPLNEEGRAARCAAHFGLRHEVLAVEPARIADRLPGLLAAFGEPFTYGLHSAFLDSVADLGVRELLAGTGADGWYLGWQERNALRAQSLHPVVRHGLARGVQAVRLLEACFGLGDQGAVLPGLGAKAVGYHGGLWSLRTGRPYYTAAYMMPAAMRLFLARDRETMRSARAARRALFDDAVDALRSLPADRRFKSLAQRFYGADMMEAWNHAAGRAHGLVIRTPYYDRALLGALEQLTLEGPDKAELRTFAATLMPPEMAHAPKVAQGVPLAAWLRGALKPLVMDGLAPARLEDQGLFSPPSVARLIDLHMRGARDLAWPIWILLTVTLWQDHATGLAREAASR